PVERKMMINALNSGAKVFMADFEDALSPPWTNVIAGQVNCMEAVRRTLEHESPEGKRYRLGDRLATLVVRPRGWHLQEKHVLFEGEPISASLFDFGLYFFHNARELLSRGSGPYFYLPKLENHLEARLWNDVFVLAQQELGIPPGTVRATVLIETILAAFEMDEILYELRDHAAGLNAGRWDYLFSMIKNFRDRADFLLPDRSQLTMTVPFMRAYTELLVKTCHRRGAHAIGGMAAFIPSRRDPAVNETALARVREDKAREAAAGYDGAWVAHPDLVAVVEEVFQGALGRRPNQKERQRDDVHIRPDQLLDVRVPGGRVTEAGVRGNISVALQYLAAWLGGSGAVAINNLMEDAATAEIARSQLWQWIRHGATTETGEKVTLGRCRTLLHDEIERLAAPGGDRGRLESAAELLDGLISAGEFPEFLTLAAYQRL
ncbi:MAG TPA: malate synthase A, partial [Gemmatimonadales bacterium]|nr:malate synthase A [Gemmatimonadales bacterium]